MQKNLDEFYEIVQETVQHSTKDKLQKNLYKSAGIFIRKSRTTKFYEKFCEKMNYFQASFVHGIYVCVYV